MELWPENDSIARYKHTGIAIIGILFLVTLILAKYLEGFSSLMTLPITASPSSSSSAYFFICLIVLLGLGLKCLSESDKLKGVQYGLAFWGCFLFAFVIWVGFNLLNVKADSSIPKKIQVNVIGKYSLAGKGGSSEYLDVVEVNGKEVKYRFRVTANVYFKSNVNDKFNLWIKQGYFNRPWVTTYNKLDKLS